jgi:hypothetical protein
MITPSRRDSVEFWIVPVPRQELIEFARRLISNAGKNVSQPSLRIDVVELGGLCRPPNYAESVVFPRFLADRRLVGSA